MDLFKRLLISRSLGARRLQVLGCCVAILLSGCGSKYYQYEVQAEVNQKLVGATYNFHCAYTFYWTGGSYDLEWVPVPSLSHGIKRLKDDSVILFDIPDVDCTSDTAGTGPDGTASVGDVTVVDSVEHPSLVQIFTPERTKGVGMSVAIISRVRRLTHHAPDTILSSDERDLFTRLQDNSHGFEAVTMVALPQSWWQRSGELKTYFEAIKSGVAVAPEAKPADGWSCLQKNNSFSAIADVEYRQGLERSLVKDGPIWRVSADVDSHSARLRFAASVLSSDQVANRVYKPCDPPLVTVEYGGKAMKFVNSQQVFDATSRELVIFSNDLWALPYLGNRE